MTHSTMTDKAVNGEQPLTRSSVDFRPSIYVINAAAITKPHAVRQLSSNIKSNDVDIAAVTETHLKNKHADSVVAIPDYTLLRRDRRRRKGGGVALYVRSSLSVLLRTFSADNRTYELLWAKIDKLFVGVLYHPPKPCYEEASLLDYLESAVVQILCYCPDADVVLAGDFTHIVHQPTLGTWLECSRPDIRITSDLHYSACRHLCAKIRP